jgi:arsenical pump membrane protein
LLAAVFVFGTLTTTVLSNDATVVLVTPVILVACRTLGLPPLPYLFACTFVADTASSMLPISNPINLLYSEQFDISFQHHAALLVVPTLLAVTVNALAFHLLFRTTLPRRFDPAPLLARAGTPLGRFERGIAVGIGCVAIAYVVAAVTGVQPYWVTLAGGTVLAGVALAGGRIAPVDLVRVQPASLYAFVVGLALVVAAADSAGLLNLLGRAVTRATEAGGVAGLVGLSLGTALGTNLVNNWTMALAVIPPLQRAGATQALAAGSMLGADIGPNFSVVGSLATLIWLTEVRREGLAVSGRTYVRIGVIATLPALLVATVALYLMQSLA